MNQQSARELIQRQSPQVKRAQRLKKHLSRRTHSASPRWSAVREAAMGRLAQQYQWGVRSAQSHGCG